jgi:hypothetical protein
MMGSAGAPGLFTGIFVMRFFDSVFALPPAEGLFGHPYWAMFWAHPYAELFWGAAAVSLIASLTVHLRPRGSPNTSRQPVSGAAG